MNTQNLIDGAIAGGFASFCGVLNYWSLVLEGREFSWRECMLHILVSAVAGFITFQLLLAVGIDANAASALCGVSGWMGTRAMKIFESLFQAKLGMKNDRTPE